MILRCVLSLLVVRLIETKTCRSVLEFEMLLSFRFSSSLLSFCFSSLLSFGFSSALPLSTRPLLSSLARLHRDYDAPSLRCHGSLPVIDSPCLGLHGDLHWGRSAWTSRYPRVSRKEWSRWRTRRERRSRFVPACLPTHTSVCMHNTGKQLKSTEKKYTLCLRCPKLYISSVCRCSRGTSTESGRGVSGGHRSSGCQWQAW